MADDGAKKRDINNQYLAFSLCDFMQTVLMASAAAALEQSWNALVLCLLSPCFIPCMHSCASLQHSFIVNPLFLFLNLMTFQCIFNRLFLKLLNEMLCADEIG